MSDPAGRAYQRLREGQAGLGLRGLARAASWGYGAAAWLDASTYAVGLRKVTRLPAPVVGVGGITAGGAGKTPLAMAVVEALGRLGLPVAVLSRGYGRVGKEPVTWVSLGQGPMVGVDQAGDEPLLMAKRLAVPVAVGPDRAVVGRAVLERLGPRVLVGDDLFQHRRLYRDLDIVALDASDPLGGDAILPRGGLREPASGLDRAHALVLTRAKDKAQVEAARSRLARLLGDKPLLACRHRLAGLWGEDGERVEDAALPGLKALAFCGLAGPRGFFDALNGLGLDLRDTVAFADHHPFSPAELAELVRRAAGLDAQALVCSEKDRQRLPAVLPDGPPLLTARLELEFWPEYGSLEGLLVWGLKDWRPAGEGR